MKKKDLIFYAGTAVLLAFSTQQVKADEQHASDQTPENTSAIVATTTSSEAQSTTADVVGNDQAVQTENTVATVATPVTPTPSSDKETNEKVPSEQPTTAVVASRAPYGARARVVESEDNSLPVEKVEKPSGTLTIENNNVETGTFDAVIRNVVAPNGLKEVLVPTWSDKDWQDDIVWHKAVRQSDGSYRATIKASDHKNEDGKYNVHVHFIDVNNRRSYVTETVTEVKQIKPSGTVTIENNNTVTGTFDAVIRNVVAPNGLKEVLVPTWSDKDWQDDIVWHKAVRQSDGSYRATIKASD
ncbi:GBS Bsp-like repeat-containing protein, partial [Streptococcus sp.]